MKEQGSREETETGDSTGDKRKERVESHIEERWDTNDALHTSLSIPLDLYK